MNTKGAKELEILELEFEKIIKDVEKYDEETLNKIPENGWSVLQTFHHIMLAEQGGLRYLKKKLSGNASFENTSWKSKFRMIVLKLSLRSSFKFKAPKVISGDNLPEKSSLKMVKSAFEVTRKEAKIYLQNLPEELWDKGIYNHPFAGRITLIGMIQFWQEHQRSHSKQIRRVLKENS